MERARAEAEGFVRALHYFNKEESLWNNAHVTPGQVMCFLTYAIVSLIVICGELARKFFYKPVVTLRRSVDDSERMELLRMEVE